MRSPSTSWGIRCGGSVATDLSGGEKGRREYYGLVGRPRLRRVTQGPVARRSGAFSSQPASMRRSIIPSDLFSRLTLFASRHNLECGPRFPHRPAVPPLGSLIIGSPKVSTASSSTNRCGWCPIDAQGRFDAGRSAEFSPFLETTGEERARSAPVFSFSMAPLWPARLHGVGSVTRLANALQSFSSVTDDCSSSHGHSNA